MRKNTHDQTRRVFLRNTAVAAGAAALCPDLVQQAFATEPGNEPGRRPNLVFSLVKACV